MAENNLPLAGGIYWIGIAMFPDKVNHNRIIFILNIYSCRLWPCQFYSVISGGKTVSRSMEIPCAGTKKRESNYCDQYGQSRLHSDVMVIRALSRIIRIRSIITKSVSAPERINSNRLWRLGSEKSGYQKSSRCGNGSDKHDFEPPCQKGLTFCFALKKSENKQANKCHQYRGLQSVVRMWSEKIWE